MNLLSEVEYYREKIWKYERHTYTLEEKSEMREKYIKQNCKRYRTSNCKIVLLLHYDLYLKGLKVRKKCFITFFNNNNFFHKLHVDIDMRKFLTFSDPVRKQEDAHLRVQENPHSALRKLQLSDFFRITNYTHEVRLVEELTDDDFSRRVKFLRKRSIKTIVFFVLV